MQKPTYEELEEQVRELDRLRESEEKFRSIVDNANEGITIAQDTKLKFVNRKIIEISGYSLSEITSMPFLDLVHPDDREMVKQRYLERYENKKGPETYELSNQAKLIVSDCPNRQIMSLTASVREFQET